MEDNVVDALGGKTLMSRKKIRTMSEEGPFPKR